MTAIVSWQDRDRAIRCRHFLIQVAGLSDTTRHDAAGVMALSEEQFWGFNPAYVGSGSRAAVKMACRPRTVSLPLRKVNAPRPPLAARPQLPDQRER